MNWSLSRSSSVSSVTSRATATAPITLPPVSDRRRAHPGKRPLTSPQVVEHLVLVENRLTLERASEGQVAELERVAIGPASWWQLQQLGQRSLDHFLCAQPEHARASFVREGDPSVGVADEHPVDHILEDAGQLRGPALGHFGQILDLVPRASLPGSIAERRQDCRTPIAWETDSDD